MHVIKEHHSKKHGKKHGMLLTIYVWYICIGASVNVVGYIWQLLTLSAQHLPPTVALDFWMTAGLIALHDILLFVCAFAIWRWKKWGVYGIYVIAVVFTPVYIKAHQPLKEHIISLVFLVLFTFLIRPLWKNFA